ncbi:hypothetical protein LTR94_034830, partial [Friedmanniomyces endolithicus]
MPLPMVERLAEIEVDDGGGSGDRCAGIAAGERVGAQFVGEVKNEVHRTLALAPEGQGALAPLRPHRLQRFGRPREPDRRGGQSGACEEMAAIEGVTNTHCMPRCSKL